MMIINLILISFITCYIIDISGIIDSLDSFLQKKFKSPVYHTPKPFNCSLCMAFWFGLIYLLLAGSLTLPLITITCLLSMLTPVITRLLYFIRGFLDKVLEGFETYFNL